jgi:virginiamycin B lyase
MTLQVEHLEDRLTPSGVTITEFPVFPPGASGLAGGAVSSDGSYWFSEYTRGFQIAKISPTGVVTNFNQIGAPPIIDNAGNVWFATGPFLGQDGGGTGITEMTQDGTVIHQFSFTSPNANPLNLILTFNPVDKNIWFTDPFEANVIGRLNSATGSVTYFPLAIPDSAANITADPNGNLWFTATGTTPIGELVLSTVSDLNGPTINYYQTPYGSPRGLTYGPDGNLWATEASNGISNAIIQLNPTTGVVTTFTNGLSPNSGAYSMTVGLDGALWFTEENADNIGRITTDGTITEYAIPTSGAMPNAIAASPTGLWFSEYGGGNMGQIMLALGTTTTVTSSANPSILNQPVTFTAIVTAASGTPTGTVTFMDGTTILNTVTLDATGEATYTTNTLSVGDHVISAVYSGGSDFAGSTSENLTEHIDSPQEAAQATITYINTLPQLQGQNTAGAVTDLAQKVANLLTAPPQSVNGQLNAFDAKVNSLLNKQTLTPEEASTLDAYFAAIIQSLS